VRSVTVASIETQIGYGVGVWKILF
jgi:hypothetical protein